MPKKIQEVPIEQWETETGLVDDVDGWIKNAKFGVNEKYAEKITITEDTKPGAGNMFMADLVDENGEKIAAIGYSIGSGWTVVGNGESIEHATRTNPVKSTQYGLFVDRCVKQLNAPINKWGVMTSAETWEDLGFHWKQESHETMKVDEKTGKKETKSQLMPVSFLGEWDEGPGKSNSGGKQTESSKAVAEKAKNLKKGNTQQASNANTGGNANANTDSDGGIVDTLSTMAKSMGKDAFITAALKFPDVTGNGDLMRQVTNKGDKGFWATHQE